MKFFTTEWWAGRTLGNPWQAFTDYTNHLASLADRLPPGVLEFRSPVAGHDCRLHTLTIDKGTLTLCLIGPDDPSSNRDRYAHEWLWQFSYAGLHSLRWVAGPDMAPPYCETLDDLGYHEFDLEQGHLVHRLLFAGGVELVVVAQGFEGRREPSRFPPRTPPPSTP